MEKCINLECEDNVSDTDENCALFMRIGDCKRAKIEEFAEISVDELTRMRDKLDRQTAFIDFLKEEMPKTLTKLMIKYGEKLNEPQ